MSAPAPAAYLNRRSKIDNAWGVPVGVLRLSELVAARPQSIHGSAAWARGFEDLSRAEKNVIYAAVMRMEQGHKKLRGNFNAIAGKSHDTAARFWATISSDMLWNKLGSFAITHPTLNEGRHAPDLGPANYPEREKALICLNDTLSLEDELGGHFLGEKIRPDALAQIDHDAWRALILEHELAHIAGADEEQADLIAAAKVMKELGRDQEVRMLADLRAVNSIANFVQAALFDKMKALGLDDMLCNMRMCDDAGFDKKVAFHRRYSWKQMQALDHAVRKGVKAARSMNDDEIRDLRFRKIDPGTTMQEGIASALLEICFEKGFYSPTPGLLVMAALDFHKRVMAEADPGVKPDDIPALRMLSRFTGAAVRLMSKPGDDEPAAKKTMRKAKRSRPDL